MCNSQRVNRGGFNPFGIRQCWTRRLFGCVQFAAFYDTLEACPTLGDAAAF